MPQFTENGVMTRLPMHDPRTVARDIPGIFDSIFPQLTPGIVAHFNRTMESSECEAIPIALVQESKLQKAMLFELGFAVGEKLLAGNNIDWDECLRIATARQRRHFDAQLPTSITTLDMHIAETVGKNIYYMLSELSASRRQPVMLSLTIPGFQWISSGQGDFAIGPTLIEVKCNSRNFSSSDYRQIVMYWLLSFAASVESDSLEWSDAVLLNPRSTYYVEFDFDEFLDVISSGRTKIEILGLFYSMVGTREIR